MGFKKKLGMGIMSGIMGVSLIGGGTYAYFSDSADATVRLRRGHSIYRCNPQRSLISTTSLLETR